MLCRGHYQTRSSTLISTSALLMPLANHFRTGNTEQDMHTKQRFGSQANTFKLEMIFGILFKVLSSLDDAGYRVKNKGPKPLDSLEYFKKPFSGQNRDVHGIYILRGCKLTFLANGYRCRLYSYSNLYADPNVIGWYRLCCGFPLPGDSFAFFFAFLCFFLFFWLCCLFWFCWLFSVFPFW